MYAKYINNLRTYAYSIHQTLLLCQIWEYQGWLLSDHQSCWQCKLQCHPLVLVSWQYLLALYPSAARSPDKQRNSINLPCRNRKSGKHFSHKCNTLYWYETLQRNIPDMQQVTISLTRWSCYMSNTSFDFFFCMAMKVWWQDKSTKKTGT